jgi:signal transduction histidine kinase
MKTDLQLTISQKGVLLVCVPLVFQLVFLGAFGWLLHQSREEAAAASRSREIVAETDRMLKSMYFSGSALASFAMEKNADMDKNYEECERQTWESFHKLEKLTADDPAQTAILARLQPKMKKALDILKTTRESLEDRMSAFAFVKTHRLTKRIAELIEEMVVMTQEIADRERDKRKEVIAARAERNVQIMLSAGIALDVVLAIGLALVVTRGITNRLRLLSENTVRMSKKQPLLQKQAGTDEIARLDQSFHDMAAAVAEAERQKQEFVAMIGHDLGTPLTLIYSTMHELSERKDELDDEATRAKLRHLEDELARLMGLIRDLLDVSKMEAGRFVVHQENVFLWPIIERAVSTIEPAAKAKALNVVREIDDFEIAADDQPVEQRRQVGAGWFHHQGCRDHCFARLRQDFRPRFRPGNSAGRATARFRTVLSVRR